MKIEEKQALEYYESHQMQIKELIMNAYEEGYRHGLKKSHDLTIEGVRFVDLGLPSGTLWSSPVYQFPLDCGYYNYVMESYNDVSDLSIPALEDFQELLQYCKVIFKEGSRSGEVVIVGPSGERIVVETKNHLNRPENPNSHMRLRQGENVPSGINMFWLKSEISGGDAKVGVIDTNTGTFYHSKHYIGLKLPYLLIKK